MGVRGHERHGIGRGDTSVRPLSDTISEALSKAAKCEPPLAKPGSVSSKQEGGGQGAEWARVWAPRHQFENLLHQNDTKGHSLVVLSNSKVTHKA